MVLALAAAVLAAAAVVELAAGGGVWRGEWGGVRRGGASRARSGAAAAGRARSSAAAAGRARTGEAAAGRARNGAAAAGRARRSGPLTALLAALGRRVGVTAAPADLASRLEAAGAPMTAAEVGAVKWGAAVAAAVAALPLATLLPGRLGPVAIAIAPAGAFLAPDLWLARRTRRRRAAMAVELADVLDLLHVAVAAGLTPMRALDEVGRRRSGPLAGELRAAATRAALGVPRADALARLTRRCPLEGVTALTAAIVRAERHGAPLAPALIALAADARAQRAQRLRERAGRAAPKIQLVVALLLVPAVMLLVGACLAAALL
jgi:tight adherence protein C